jgi:hypothetical protein
MTSSDPDVIRRQIEDTRRELSYDVDALNEKVNPARVMDRRVTAAKGRITRVKEKVMGTASDTTSTVQYRASDAVGTVQGTASSAAGTVQDAASSAADSVQNAASTAVGAVAFVMGKKKFQQVNPKPERTVETLQQVPGALKPN